MNPESCIADQSFSSLVQFGQRVALMLISLWQKGQTLVVGSAELLPSSSGFGLVGSLHDSEEDQRGQQELNHHSREGDQGAGESGSAVLQLRQALNNGVQEDFHDRGNDLVEGGAQNHGYSQIQDIALNGKLFELFQQILHDNSPPLHIIDLCAHRSRLPALKAESLRVEHTGQSGNPGSA
jgi:hypothetical protein